MVHGVCPHVQTFLSPLCHLLMSLTFLIATLCRFEYENKGLEGVCSVYTAHIHDMSKGKCVMIEDPKERMNLAILFCKERILEEE